MYVFMPSPNRLLSSFVFLLVLSASGAQADVRQLVFEPPREATFRQKNGALGRGLLVSIDSLRVRVRLQSGESKVVPLEELQFIRTVDTQFSYKSSDDINTIISNGSQLENTLITNAPGEDAPMVETAPSTNGGFGTYPTTNSGAMNNGGFGTAQPSPSTNNGGFGTGQPANTDNAFPPGMIVICDNCQKEVHTSAEHGQKCPHCGIEWSLDLPQSAYTEKAIAAGGNAGPANGINQRPVDPLNRIPQAAPPAGLPPPAAPVAQEFNMANIPVWMKAGLFFLFAGAGYYMFFYRA